MMLKTMNNIVIKINKKYFVEKYGIDFYAKFKTEVGKKLDEIIPEVPDIGDSIFKSSYLMAIFLLLGTKY